MSWWQMAMFAFGVIVIFAGGVSYGIAEMWRRQEKRDGKR